MDEYLQLTLDVFDSAGNQAKVRKTLTVRGLIDEVIREFDDLDRKNAETYAIFLKGQPKPLERDRTISQLDLQPGDELEFRYARRSRRESLSGERKAFLREEDTRKMFELHWQPALIGRPDADPAHNELLAINLESLPDGLRVSRSHAQITSDSGIFYLEGLASNNPTYLNDEPVLERRRLYTGDRIRVGKTRIVLTFVQE